MREHQHIEWKESWRDEYQKWICGFANADGGVLVIGRNDRGAVVGVEARSIPVGKTWTHVGRRAATGADPL